MSNVDSLLKIRLIELEYYRDEVMNPLDPDPDTLIRIEKVKKQIAFQSVPSYPKQEDNTTVQF